MPKDASTGPSAAQDSPLAGDLHWCLVRLVRGLGAAEVEAVGDCGVSLRGYAVLCALAADGGAESQLALARSVAMDKTTLVRVLDELEGDGHVLRVADAQDRRVRMIEITRKGLEVRRRASRVVAGVEEAFLAQLAPEQREAFRGVARTLGTGPFAETFDARTAAV